MWQRPTPRRSTQRRSRWPRLLAAFGVVAVAAAIAVVAFVLVSRGTPSYPSRWDAQVAPIAARVEAFRGMRFKHPVAVKYLSASAFEKKVTDSPADLKKHRTQIAQATGLLRAAGLLGPNVDLAAALNTTQGADTSALYEFGPKTVYVRGTGPFTVETRVTLAHELTHALQDQYFNLGKLERQADHSKVGSSDALTALIEGDASRIENRYLAEQSLGDRREYVRLSAQTANQANRRTQHVPAVVDTFFSAPYIFGPQVVHVLETAGGNTAINTALTGPTPSTRIYLDPTAVNDLPPALPTIPALQPGEKKLAGLSANADSFDNFTLYLTLAARLDSSTALRAADAYASGSEVVYTNNGVTCFRAAIVGTNANSDTYLATAIRRWTQTVPDAHIDSTATPLIFHACDPGSRATTPDDRHINAATSLAAGRDALVATVSGRLSRQLAACLARVLVDEADIRDALVKGDTLNQPTPKMLRESVAAGLTCRNNPLAGLP
jgi:hypothetical protein